MKKASLIFSLISCAVILAFYNNCGESFVASGFVEEVADLTSRSNNCEKIKKSSFINDGFHSFLVTNCNSCHISGGIAQGAFADSNTGIAFATFNSFGWSRISENAISDNHPGPKNGPGLQSSSDSLSIKWQETISDYNSCLKSDKQNSKGKYDILSLEKVINVTDKWQTFSFGLNNNFYESSINHNLNVDFKVDIQNYYGEGDKPALPIGYLFKQPRFEFKGSEDTIYIESIKLFNNGIPIENFEVWEQLEVLIEKQKPANDSVADSIVINDDQRLFAYIDDNIDSFKNLSIVVSKALDNTGGKNNSLIPDEPNKVEPKHSKPVITRRVSYVDLTGNSEFGIIKKNCFQCHSGNNISGGVAFDTFAAAKASASRIAVRINDASRPMPQSGLMDVKSVAIIEKWIELGSPQN